MFEVYATLFAILMLSAFVGSVAAAYGMLRVIQTQEILDFEVSFSVMQLRAERVAGLIDLASTLEVAERMDREARVQSYQNVVTNSAHSVVIVLN